MWSSKRLFYNFGRVLNMPLKFGDLNVLPESHIKVAPNPIKTKQKNAVY